ncbi:energy transducer TonB [Caulobacter segnis]
MVGYEQIKTTDDAERPRRRAGQCRTFFEFLAPGDANPDWLRKPTGQDIANVFPKKAIEHGVGGKATIGCRMTAGGFLQNCKVLFESPKYNFGAAGLQIMPQLRMTPKIRGGKAVAGGTVAIPDQLGSAQPVLHDGQHDGRPRPAVDPGPDPGRDQRGLATAAAMGLTSAGRLYVAASTTARAGCAAAT